jgi:hypothetical protein
VVGYGIGAGRVVVYKDEVVSLACDFFDWTVISVSLCSSTARGNIPFCIRRNSIGGIALGAHLYPVHGSFVLSFPNTVVHLGVLIVIPLTVYVTLYQGKLSSKNLTNSFDDFRSMNGLK